MEQNGLRAQVFRDAAGASKTVTQEMMDELERFDIYLAKDSESNSGRFISGTGNKTIDELGIDKVKQAIASVTYSGKFSGKLLNDTIENKYFENYVGH